MARVMVMALSQEKLPLSMSHDWVTMITAAPTPATGCGVKSVKGTSSWARWLATASSLCSGLGRWWKYQLRGLGRGWVSWW